MQTQNQALASEQVSALAEAVVLLHKSALSSSKDSGLHSTHNRLQKNEIENCSKLRLWKCKEIVR